MLGLKKPLKTTFYYILTSFAILNTSVAISETIQERNDAVIRGPNPFALDLEEQGSSIEDYQHLQDKLRKVSIAPIIKMLFEECLPRENYTYYEDFLYRCTRGTHQKMVDVGEGVYPEVRLEKLGRGGDQCIVCYVSLNGGYTKLLDSVIENLKKMRFNGYFLSFRGAWPSADTVKYAAIPYSFKMCAMMEAYKRGFNHVLWMDAALLPKRNIQPIFNLLRSSGSVFSYIGRASFYIFPATARFLSEWSGKDFSSECFHFQDQILGLKMDRPEVRLFIKDYLELLELGTPFLSCFPNEFVNAAIILKNKLPWFNNAIDAGKFFIYNPDHGDRKALDWR